MALKIVSKLSPNNSYVALETAVLTHGLPRGLALEVFREMMSAVEAGGAISLPVAVAGGDVCVGLDDETLVKLSEETEAVKVGLADLPVVCAKKQWGGTTVATTLWASSQTGVKVFATGGIGGVHRGVAAELDVSGDLVALSRFGGCVVCSGAKVICDLQRTFEVLETLGVTVLGYGCDELPAFTCTGSGIPVVHRVDSPEDVAAVLRERDSLGLTGAVLVCQPPPAEFALDYSALAPAVERAVDEARRSGISGQGVTPFLLSRLKELTGGESLDANRALLVQNASLAAAIALRIT